VSDLRIRRMGTTGWLVDCAPEEGIALARELLAAPLDGQTSVRVGAASVLVTLEPGAMERARRALLARGHAPLEPGAASGRAHTIDVVYDGPDLGPLADRLAMSTEALVTRHQEQSWTVAFCGFAPGFAYLRGWDLDVPRLDSPRPSVPAGSVGLAGPYSAVYPSASPGGWQLVGRTDHAVWDVDRLPPAALAPGDRVRYRAVRDQVGLAAPSAVPGRVSGPAAATVLAAGPLTLVEDGGRPGQEHLGVAPSGAADTRAARLANRLVGNPRSAALLETLGGLRIRAERDLVVAVTGARTTAVVETPDELPGAAAVPAATPWAVRTGQVLSIGQPEHGLRAYLALRGGIDVPLVLGSRSTDVLGRLGPARLESGSVLAVGRATEAVGMPEPEPGPPSSGRAATQVRVVLGPRDDEFGAAGTTRLVGQEWTVSATSNRVGLRLEGAPVVRLVAGEVPSEPMVPGAIQVPPAGLPVVLFRDHPVTGGYPVIGVVVPEDLDLLAQLAPGDHLRLSVVAPPD